MTDAPTDHCQATISFASEAEARRAAAAIEPDNDGYLQCRVEGDRLLLEAHGPAGTILNTLEDALGCLRALGIE